MAGYHQEGWRAESSVSDKLAPTLPTHRQELIHLLAKTPKQQKQNFMGTAIWFLLQEVIDFTSRFIGLGVNIFHYLLFILIVLH